MKKSIIYGIALIVSACDNSSTTTPQAAPKKNQPTNEYRVEHTEKKETKKNVVVSISQTENELIDLVWKLPEVQSLSKELETKSKNKRHLSMRISSEPSDDQEYYGITVAEDNGLALATYYEFHVYPGNEIRYYDAIEDQELTLEEWRKK